MSQLHLITFVLKIVEPLAILSLARWVYIYSRLEKWWKHDIGKTLVLKSGILIFLLTLSFISLFINLQNIWVVDWVSVGLIAAIVPVMEWRTQVWKRVSREARQSGGRGPTEQQVVNGDRPGPEDLPVMKKEAAGDLQADSG